MSQREEDAIEPFQVKFSTVPGTRSIEFQKHFPTYLEGLTTSSPHNFVSVPDYAYNAEKLYNFEPRKEDVWIMTFPKSGTTWMQEMVWLLTHNNDFEKAKTSLHVRSPFFEMAYLLPKFLTEKYERETISKKSNLPVLGKLLEIMSYCKLTDFLRPAVKKVIDLFMGNMMRNLEEMEDMSGPRILKTHIPFKLLNPKLLDTSKVVYVARNPKDVIVSYFHYHKLMDYHQYSGDLETFAEYFMKDTVYNAPYFPHLLDAWNKRHHPNLLFVFYEDLKRDLKGQTARIASFLGKSMSEEELERLREHLRFDNFAKNDAVNNEFAKELGVIRSQGHFIRKGKTGDWKNHFSPELSRRIDEWIEKNLAGTDLQFVTELDEQD